MKPNFVTLIVLLLINAYAFPQTGTTPGDDVSSEMYGNPYLIKDWSAGSVKFTSGRIVTQFKLRFDCVKNQLQLQFQGSTFAAESKVKEFVMYTGKKKDSLVFRKGYPSIDKSTEHTYYHLLLEDKASLLRLVSRNIVEEKEMIANNGVRGRLEEEEKYYLLKEGNMIRLSSSKEELVKTLPGKSDALSQFITEKRLKFKTPDDFVQFAKKYNELLHQ